jgi:hypothetical protein
MTRDASSSAATEAKKNGVGLMLKLSYKECLTETYVGFICLDPQMDILA